MDAYINTYVKNSWNPILNAIIKKHEKEMGLLRAFIDDEYSHHYNETFPHYWNIFKAFELPPERIKVIIIGQDPYPNPMPNGRAFDCELFGGPEKSLVNIYKELELEYGVSSKNKSLQSWADQGVFLINTVLTIRKGYSHMGRGWELFTGEVFNYLARNENIVWLLLGQHAAKSIAFTPKLAIYAAHPSPLSASKGFFGSNCFKKVNELLKIPIIW